MRHDMTKDDPWIVEAENGPSAIITECRELCRSLRAQLAACEGQRNLLYAACEEMVRVLDNPDVDSWVRIGIAGDKIREALAAKE